MNRCSRCGVELGTADIDGFCAVCRYIPSPASAGSAMRNGVEIEGIEFSKAQLMELRDIIECPGWKYLTAIIRQMVETRCTEKLGASQLTAEDLLRLSGVYRGLCEIHNIAAQVINAVEEMRVAERAAEPE